MNRITVVPGISFPFYPPRPFSGMPLRAHTVDRVLADSAHYHLSRKLNGDRAVVLVHEGVQIINRHLTPYSFRVGNVRKLATLPDLTLLDGEVWKGEFFPFEAVAVGGLSFAAACPSVRAGKAEELCRELGIDWLFSAPTLSWLKKLRKNLPSWEGVVKKALGSAYVPLASDTQDSKCWSKSKW